MLKSKVTLLYFLILFFVFFEYKMLRHTIRTLAENTILPYDPKLYGHTDKTASKYELILYMETDSIKVKVAQFEFFITNPNDCMHIDIDNGFCEPRKEFLNRLYCFLEELENIEVRQNNDEKFLSLNSDRARDFMSIKDNKLIIYEKSAYSEYNEVEIEITLNKCNLCNIINEIKALIFDIQKLR